VAAPGLASDAHCASLAVWPGANVPALQHDPVAIALHAHHSCPNVSAGHKRDLTYEPENVSASTDHVGRKCDQRPAAGRARASWVNPAATSRTAETSVAHPYIAVARVSAATNIFRDSDGPVRRAITLRLCIVNRVRYFSRDLVSK
jgi:hypothetical protein